MLSSHTPRRHAPSAPAGDILRQAHTSSYSIVSQHQLMIAFSGPVKVLSRLLFNRVQTHDLPRKKSH